MCFVFGLLLNYYKCKMTKFANKSPIAAENRTKYANNDYHTIYNTHSAYIWIKWANAFFQLFWIKITYQKRKMTKCERDVIRLFWRVLFREHKNRALLFISSAIWCWLLSRCAISFRLPHASCVEHHLIWICDVFDLCLVSLYF